MRVCRIRSPYTTTIIILNLCTCIGPTLLFGSLTLHCQPSNCAGHTFYAECSRVYLRSIHDAHICSLSSASVLEVIVSECTTYLGLIDICSLQIPSSAMRGDQVVPTSQTSTVQHRCFPDGVSKFSNAKITHEITSWVFLTLFFVGVLKHILSDPGFVSCCQVRSDFSEFLLNWKAVWIRYYNTCTIAVAVKLYTLMTYV